MVHITIRINEKHKNYELFPLNVMNEIRGRLNRSLEDIHNISVYEESDGKEVLLYQMTVTSDPE